MKNKICTGFSLIEMIVAVTIILILTGIGVANFSTLSNNKNLKSATGELAAWLSSARNLATTGQLPDEELGLKFVKVTVTDSGITAAAVDTEDNLNTFFSNTLTNAGTLSVSISVGESSVSSFGFNKGTGRLLTQDGEFTDGPVRIVLSNGESSVLVINDLGIINEE